MDLGHYPTSNPRTKIQNSNILLQSLYWLPCIILGLFESRLLKDSTIGPFTLAKTKIQKPGFFVVPFTLREKPITFRLFGTKSACAKKPESHTDVLVSGAHARLLSTFDRTRVVRITLRAAVGWFRWRSRITSRDQKPE